MKNNVGLKTAQIIEMQHMLFSEKKTTLKEQMNMMIESCDGGEAFDTNKRDECLGALGMDLLTIFNYITSNPNSLTKEDLEFASKNLKYVADTLNKIIEKHY